MIFKRKLHRAIERTFGAKKNSLKNACETLKLKYKFTDQDIIRITAECEAYCKENNNDFAVAFNLYVSCLNNQKKTIV
jgi:hypothetical protein